MAKGEKMGVDRKRPFTKLNKNQLQNVGNPFVLTGDFGWKHYLLTLSNAEHEQGLQGWGITEAEGDIDKRRNVNEDVGKEFLD